MSRSSDGPRFRFAVLRTERPLCAWEAAVVDRLGQAGGVLVSALEVTGHEPRPGPIERLAERLAQGKPRGNAGAGAPATRALVLDGSPEAREAARLLALDLVLAFAPIAAFLPLVDEPDALAKSGIWTYLFGAADGPATTPPGFETIVRGSSLAKVSLVRLSPSGAGVPLEEEWLRVEPGSYGRTRTLLAAAAASLAVRCTQRHREVPATGHGRSAMPIPPTVRRGEALAARLLLALAGRSFGQLVRRGLYRQDWNIGIIDRPIEHVLSGLDMREVDWLPVRQGDRFLADPFAIPLSDERALLLAEEFVGASSTGRIVAATVEGARYVTEPAPILDLDAHLSYPYLVREGDGGWVFAPESSASSELALYRIDPHAGTVARDAVLLDGFAATDATIVEHDARWWLFATDGAGDPDGHLHIWHAPGLRGPWTAHARNPVKCDVRSARPGGTPFAVDGVLYRPAQDDSTAYGGALVINRVDVLSPDAFAETVVARVEPDPAGPYPAGIHTISAVGHRTLVDGKRFRFDPLAKLRRRLAKLRRRLWRGRVARAR